MQHWANGRHNFAFHRLIVAATIAGSLTLPSTGLSAQERAAPSAAVQYNPVILANPNGINVEGAKPDFTSLRLDLLDVAVKMDGRLADVTLTARVANPTNENQQAQFTLALPDNAVVTGYALDIEGKMIDGVLVDLPKAKAVYEAEVRKNIDPGFASVRGNKFETRIYPIASEGTRTITVRFVTPSDAVDGFLFPIRTASAVGRYQSSITINGFAQKTPAQAAEIQGKPVNDRIGVNGGRLASTLLVSQHSNGRRFFQINDVPGGDNQPKERRVDRLRLYWDRSLSRRDDRIAEELALIDTLIKRLTPKSIEVVDFADGLMNRRNFADGAAVVAYLRALPLRGATSFKSLDVDTSAQQADLCLLFSDGAPTIDTAASFEPACPLNAVASADDANLARLGRWTRATRGQVFRLSGDAGISDRIVNQLMRPSVAVVDVRDSAGRKLAFRSLPVSSGWQLVGPMPDTDTLTLTLSGIGNGLTRREYKVDRPARGQNDAAGALWAAETLEAMADDPQRRDEMRKLAIDYKVAAPTMAFLVLESPEQYVKAEVGPPEGFSKDWIGRYSEAKSGADEKKKTAKEERFTKVLAEWDARKEWWNQRFDPPKTIRNNGEPNDGNVEVLPSPPEVAAPPPPPPPPPIGPVAAPVEDSVDADATQNLAEASIVTTGARRSSDSAAKMSLAPAPSGERGQTVQVDLENVLSALPYLKALDAAKPNDRLRVLAEQEKQYGHLPAFYLDASEWFRLKGSNAALADSLMLSALELPTADDETRQIVAFRLQRGGRYDLAVSLLEQIAASTDYRPQPKRQLALALIERGKKRGKAGVGDLERAFTLLVEAALEPADGAFDGVEVIALAEANALIPLITNAGGSWKLDPRLVAKLDTDVRVLIEWTNDDADLDLHVIEPSGELVYYSNNASRSGGRLSNDMTDGYGPEEYVIRRAVSGDYKVRIDGFSPDRLNPNGMGRVMVRLIRDFGRPNQQAQLIDADISFDRGGDGEGGRNDGQRGKPVATFKVGQGK